jgi:GTP 3',8-cyclase
MVVSDLLSRPLRTLRLSVTDRCNLRCLYCMPSDDYVWMARQDVLSFEEISTLVDVFHETGVNRVRLTGGEPLLRRGLPNLLEMLSVKPGLSEISLTTNAILLQEQGESLKKAGLHRINISLDTLRPDRFLALTRSKALDRVLAGIENAIGLFEGVKLDAVIIRGLNDDELGPLLEFAISRRVEIRFIEYMDVGGATGWSMAQVVSQDVMLERLSQKYGRIEPIHEDSSAPASRFMLQDGTTFGIIASVTRPFCGTCDRSRLTADGLWYICLYGTEGMDLRSPLRAGAGRVELRRMIEDAWESRSDRGAEIRAELRERTPLLSVDELRRNPHLEMHKRGG